MTWVAAVSREFPGAVPQESFVANSSHVLKNHGFLASNTIAFAGVCRDELTLSLLEDIERTWGEVFTFSSLGGMLFLGKTGFLAAQQHAPIEAGKERYAFFALPHIAVSAQGEFGIYYRPGREKASHACGALMAFQHELEQRTLQLGFDPDDMEQSLLKQHLFRKLRYGDVPDLVSLTKIAHDVILEDLERMIHLTVDPTRCHYGVFTGVQIHTSEGTHLIWPRTAYAVKDGERLDVSSGAG